MQFVDLAKIQVRSGSGGNGSASFRREKFVEFGGPDGGNGGRGGNVYVQADQSLNTLVDFRYRRHVKAGDGKAGRGRQRTGAKGRDVTLKVPVGTEILDELQENVVFDLVEHGEHKLLLAGGNGGFGNNHFKSSTNQAPKIANEGKSGVQRTFWLRLKVLADAGLVGLPNAGKSTFLSAASNARPRVADYPFTTLHPNLGTVRLDESEFILADIPGLIEGAHEGKGIGDQFLGHIERCRVLLHLVDGTSATAVDDYQVVLNEIRQYGCGLAEKPSFAVLTKSDAITADEQEERVAGLKAISKGPVLVVSAVTGDGVKYCLRCLATAIADAKLASADVKDPVPWTP